ncbi:MAG TPA: T9SS type A sorting domain-containing protein [Bacteroidia bacterium]|nr:T9SS type A sorting domain-containing protein [Bacteroidia bacterium]
MKTQTIKTAALMALISIATMANAQSGKQKKTCIVINENNNGKEVHIDTCFTGLTDEAIAKELKVMGIDDVPNVNVNIDSIMVKVNTEVGKGDSAKSEVIVIDGDGDDGEYSYSSSGGGKSKVKVVTGKSGEASAVIEGDDGNVIVTSSGDDGDAKVIVKKNGTDVVVESNSNGKNSYTYVYKKVIIKNASEDDMKRLPAEANTSGAPFTDLKMSPNPTEGTVAISYKSTGTEPLQIDVYDMNGKKVHTETMSDVSGQVTKSVSLNSYGPGVYFVHLTQGKQSETRKIVVK